MTGAFSVRQGRIRGHITGVRHHAWNEQDMTQKKNLHANGAGTQFGRQANRRSQKDILGPNCEVGLKLKALYSSIQDETIPDRFLDLLEKLDQVEQGQIEQGKAEQENMRGQNTGSVG